MATPEEQARAYLDQVLIAAGANMKALSLELGLSHSYLSQYIARGKSEWKPRWLPEEIREGLAKLLPTLDVKRLKQPPKPLKPRVDPKRASRDGQNKAQINAPHDSELVEEPGAIQLVRAYGRIRHPDRRVTAVRVVEAIAIADAADDSIVA